MDGRLSPDFVEWMQGLPAGWTDVAGVTRADRLRALGNCVVPLQAMVAYVPLLAEAGWPVLAPADTPT